MIKKILVMSFTVLFMSTCLFLSLRSFLKYREDYIVFYVASHQISQRTMMKDEDLVEVRLPKQLVSEDIYANKEEILGKYVKLGYSIPKGSLIYKGALESDIKDLAYTLLYKDQVSYDLYANEIKINTSTINDNMFLDIYVTIGNTQKPVSDLLIRNCRIIGMYDNNGRQILSYDNESRPFIISVAVEKSDVSILNKALKIGEAMAVISRDTYVNGLRSSINEQSELIEYLQ